MKEECLPSTSKEHIMGHPNAMRDFTVTPPVSGWYTVVSLNEKIPMYYNADEQTYTYRVQTETTIDEYTNSAIQMKNNMFMKYWRSC